MSLPYFPIIKGPVAPYNNVAVNPQYYQPSQFFITAITRGMATTVTISVNDNYVIGQLVRFIIPEPYGIIQLNEQTGYVISLPAANQVIVDINSLNMDAFIPSPAKPGKTKPQILAVGDTNTGQINTGRTGNKTYIPGSFINISPL